MTRRGRRAALRSLRRAKASKDRTERARILRAVGGFNDADTQSIIGVQIGKRETRDIALELENSEQCIAEHARQLPDLKAFLEKRP